MPGGLRIPPAVLNQLHDDLAAVGLPVSARESGNTPRAGTETTRQLTRFQELHGLPANGTPDDTTQKVLALSALVTTENDRTKLREKVAAAAESAPDSPAYNYWLARSAILVGDYATAHKVLPNLHGIDLGDVLVDIGPVLDPGPQPLQPELPHPENFYTYRIDLVDPDQLEQVRAQLADFTIEQWAAYLSQRDHVPVNPATIDAAYFGQSLYKARKALAALVAWQTGNRHAAHRELTLAMQSYLQCQSAVADYLEANDVTTTGTPDDRLAALLRRRRDNEATNAAFWSVLRWRRILLSLQELEDQDRVKTVGTGTAFASAGAFIDTFTAVDEFHSNTAAQNQSQRLDPLMVVLGTIWVPLAIGELNCQLRQFDAAVEGFSAVLAAQAAVDVRFRYLCEFIEVPFIRLLTLEALLGKADAQYKAGLTVDTQTFPDAPTYHGLLAAQTYLEVRSRIAEDGQYVARVDSGRDELVGAIHQAIQNDDTTSLTFRALGKAITVPTITAVTAALPGTDRAVAPHQSLATITAPDGRTTNPRVYAIALLVAAKLEQLRAGFNYLGYPADYVPPWRFSYLLERARYFAEHAKNAQRDYLNFLSNAEHEEFQEQSVAQTVEMEKSNVRIEAARVDQALAEVAASKAAADGAALHAQNAHDTASEYFDFELQADEADSWSMLGSMFGGLVKLGEGLATGNPVDVVSGALGYLGAAQGGGLKHMERELEHHKLQRAAVEADAAAAEALKKVEVARLGLVVSGLQRQAAILRHEAAVENLRYVRNRTLNSDQWFRLANAIRGVSETYLHRAIELAFLSQQAYQFESERQLDVIRFDYDLSDVGAMLAADFLLRDLDTLEQDLLVSQRSRLQQVRYVLSLARELPETLRRLSEDGEVTFSVGLEELEKHFPGLLNLRLSSVELQPVALMDPTRVTVQLTHLGFGLARLRAQPGASALNQSDLPDGEDWLGSTGTGWPAKVHIGQPETAVFTGLSRQEAASVSLISASERGAFEGLPGASSWRIDLSAKENQFVPGTLADVLITFVLSGSHDAGLREVVADAVSSARPRATTRLLSARRLLPDAWYSLVRYGRLDWAVSPGLLTASGAPGALRNLAVVLPLLDGGPELGRCTSHYPIELEVSSGSVNVVSVLPQVTLTPNGLTLEGAFSGASGVEVTWDFGDGTALGQGASVQHAYARAGRYEVSVRLVSGGRLFEYRSAVVVSAQHAVVGPLVVAPTFSAGAIGPDGTVALTLSPPSNTDVSIECAVGSVHARAETGPVTIHVKPGRLVLDFRVTRRLSARFYGKQRYLPSDPVPLTRGRAATNRTFDLATGAETTAAPNAFTARLFPSGAALSPADRWSLELPVAENPWFRSVSPSDVEEFDGGELTDAVLALEFVSA